MFWCSDVDPSGSPCLKTIDRKSFECGNFLFLYPVLLKIAYLKSANWQLSIDVQPKELRQRKIVDPSRAAPWSSVERKFSKFSGKKIKKIKRAVIFNLLANPTETPYLSVRDGKLSTAVRLVEFRPRKVAVHTFLGVVPSPYAQTAFTPEQSKAITFLS